MYCGYSNMKRIKLGFFWHGNVFDQDSRELSNLFGNIEFRNSSDSG